MLHSLGSNLISLICAGIIGFGPAYASEGGEKKAEAPEPVLPPALQMTPSNEYVTQAIRFPEISGKDLNDTKIAVTYEKGYSYVVIFFASWCVSCQRITEGIKSLVNKYAAKPIRFYFVFSRDLKSDVASFVAQTQITNVILADHDGIKEFHNPEIPTIYVGDRHGWLLTRYRKATQETLKELDKVLYQQTMF